MPEITPIRVDSNPRYFEWRNLTADFIRLQSNPYITTVDCVEKEEKMICTDCKKPHNSDNMRSVKLCGSKKTVYLCSDCQKPYLQCRLCCNSAHKNSNLIMLYPIIDGLHFNFCNNCSERLIRCAVCLGYTTGRFSGPICPICLECTKFNHKITPIEYPKDDSWMGDRHVSFELEIINKKGFNREDLPRPWIFVYDGSLTRGGIELLNDTPLVGNHAVTAVNQIYEFFKGHYNTNKSCGYHLHFDCTKEDETTVEKFARFCIQIQDSVISLVPWHRKAQYENDRFRLAGRKSYCRKLPPIGDKQTFEDYLYKTLGQAGQNEKHKYGNKYNNSRYYWWNFHSYYYRMTLECRLYQGTLKPTEVLTWAELWVKLFEYVKNTPVEVYKDEPDVLRVAQVAGVRPTTIKHFLTKRNKYNVSTS